MNTIDLSIPVAEVVDQHPEVLDLLVGPWPNGIRKIERRQMNYEQEFLKDFEEWVQTQIMVNELAMNESRRVLEEDRDERAADAYIRYESKLDAYQFIQGKFANYKAGKAFHDLPDGLFGEKHY